MDSRTCGYCGGSLFLARSDAKFCTTKCRVYASRAAKRPAFPAELLALPNWVRRDARKVPLRSDGRGAAKSNDPATWSSYADAVKSTKGVGLGFVLNGDSIGVLDLDHAINDGAVAGWAQEILDANRDTFVEVSQSGEGLHVWGLLESRKGERIRDGRNLEIYSTGRYVAMGTRLDGSPLKLSPLVIP